MAHPHTTKKTSFTVLGIFCAMISFFSSLTFANNNADRLFFIKSEFHNQSAIYSIGTQYLLKWPHSNVGVAINSSLNAASVVDKNNVTQDFITVEMGGRFGYFADLSAFVEAGVDLGEVLGNLLHSNAFERDNDRYDAYQHNHYEYPFNVDAYIGLGVGVNFNKKIRLEGFSRLREINATDWEAKSQVYSGVSLAFIF